MVAPTIAPKVAKIAKARPRITRWPDDCGAGTIPPGELMKPLLNVRVRVQRSDRDCNFARVGGRSKLTWPSTTWTVSDHRDRIDVLAAQTLS
jgi:hypothetical protein